MENNPEKTESSHHRFLRWMIRLVYRPTYVGFDRLPTEGAGMLICNHVSYMDGLLIASGLKRQVRFVIYEPIYNLPGIHQLMKWNRAIPIYPTRQKVKKALDEIAAGLESGDLICIFPEGQLTYTGGLSRFRPGIEHIIQRTPVPVYPMALIGLWGSIFSRKHPGSWKRFLPGRPGRAVHAVCGEALDPEHINVNMLQKAVLSLKYEVQD